METSEKSEFNRRMLLSAVRRNFSGSCGMRGKPAFFQQIFFLLAVATLSVALPGCRKSEAKKVFVITDMEGVGGIYDKELQCIPFQSPRFEESRKLLTGEINAAVDGLFEGGATEVVVWDGHDSSRTLSTLDIHPRARLLSGTTISPTLELDSSYNAVIFIGQHAMAGVEDGVLSHSYSSDGIQEIWINSKPAGEIGARVMLAGHFGIPVIMLAGDHAACEEIRQLVPLAECAEVKRGVSRTAAFSLAHEAARTLIREKARRAIRRLAEFRPYKMDGPVEVRVKFKKTDDTRTFQTVDGVSRIDALTWSFRGKDIVDAWLKYSSF